MFSEPRSIPPPSSCSFKHQIKLMKKFISLVIAIAAMSLVQAQEPAPAAAPTPATQENVVQPPAPTSFVVPGFAEVQDFDPETNSVNVRNVQRVLWQDSPAPNVRLACVPDVKPGTISPIQSPTVGDRKGQRPGIVPEDGRMLIDLSDARFWFPASMLEQYPQIGAQFSADVKAGKRSWGSVTKEIFLRDFIPALDAAGKGYDDIGQK